MHVICMHHLKHYLIQFLLGDINWINKSGERKSGTLPFLNSEMVLKPWDCSLRMSPDPKAVTRLLIFEIKSSPQFCSLPPAWNVCHEVCKTRKESVRTEVLHWRPPRRSRHCDVLWCCHWTGAADHGPVFGDTVPLLPPLQTHLHDTNKACPTECDLTT